MRRLTHHTLQGRAAHPHARRRTNRQRRHWPSLNFMSKLKLNVSLCYYRGRFFLGHHDRPPRFSLADRCDRVLRVRRPSERAAGAHALVPAHPPLLQPRQRGRRWQRLPRAGASRRVRRLADHGRERRLRGRDAWRWWSLGGDPRASRTTQRTPLLLRPRQRRDQDGETPSRSVCRERNFDSPPYELRQPTTGAAGGTS